MNKAILVLMVAVALAGCSQINYSQMDYPDGRKETKASRSGLFLSSTSEYGIIGKEGMSVGVQGSKTDAEAFGAVAGSAIGAYVKRTQGLP